MQEAQMASVSPEDGDPTETAFDVPAEADSDDIAVWLASPPRRSIGASCTRWQPPAVGFDNFS
jgi:hypothetical protein